jgi:hypothetical protein
VEPLCPPSTVSRNCGNSVRCVQELRNLCVLSSCPGIVNLCVLPCVRELWNLCAIPFVQELWNLYVLIGVQELWKTCLPCD